MIANII